MEERKNAVMGLCNELLSRIAANFDVINKPTLDQDSVKQAEINLFRDLMILILEERFGLEIMICGNCKHYAGTMADFYAECLKASEQNKSASKPGSGLEAMLLAPHHLSCKKWEPKEIPEKK